MNYKRLATIVGILASLFAILGGLYWYVARDVIAESQIQENTNNLLDLSDDHYKDVEILHRRITTVSEKQSVAEQQEAVNASRFEDLKQDVNKVEEQVDDMRMEQAEQRTQLENIEEDTEEIKDDLKELIRKLDHQ